jgi:DNA-binding XRE family transcriptional regulator
LTHGPVVVYLGDTMTGAELRKARERLNMTQTELAEAIGMKKNSIARMERDERPVMKHTKLSVKYLLLTMRKTTRGKKRHGD